MPRPLEIHPDAHYTRDYYMACGYTAEVLHKMATDPEPVVFYCSDPNGRNMSSAAARDVLRLTPKYMKRVIPGKSCRRSRRKEVAK